MARCPVMDSLTTKITAIWRKIPTAIRSGWITAWVVFTGTLLTIGVGLLPKLAESISTRNFEGFLDSLSLGASAALSAATAFVSGLVNTIYRVLRPIEQAYAQTPPE